MLAWYSWLPSFPHYLYIFSVLMSTCCSLLPCRRYLNKSPEDQEEDLPGLEEDIAPELNLTVLRRRTMAAAAERRMQNQQDPAPWYIDRLQSLPRRHHTRHRQSYFNPPFHIWCTVRGHCLSETIIKNHRKHGLWTVLGCVNKVGLLWIASASLIPEYLEHIIKWWMQVKKCKVALPFIHVPHTATTSLSGESVSAVIWTDFQKMSMLCIQKSLLRAGRLKLSLLDTAVWVLVCFSFYQTFFSSSFICVLMAESYMFWMKKLIWCICVFILLRVSTVNYV